MSFFTDLQWLFSFFFFFSGLSVAVLGAIVQSTAGRLLVIYCRYSSDMQSPKSCEDQEREVRAALARKGIDTRNAIVIIDQAESGTKSSRKGFQKVLAMFSREKSILLAVDDQSRFSRLDDVYSLVTDLVYAGGRFISTGENIDTDEPGWKMSVKVMELHHSTSIEDLGRRVRRGQLGRVIRDESAGDFGFGYESFFIDPEYANKYNGRGAKPARGLRIFESEATWVRRIFILFVGGWSINKIARELTQRKVKKGHRCRTEKWRPNQIRAILSNQKYIGIWTWGKMKTLRDSKGRMKQVAAADEDVSITERPHLRIVKQELWEKAKVKLEELASVYGQKKGGGKRGPKVHHTELYPTCLLTGLLECGHCHSPLQYNSSGPRVHRLCSNTSGSCEMKPRPEVTKTKDILLHFVSELLVNMPDWVAAATTEMRAAIQQATDHVPSQITELRKHLHDAETRRDNLLDFAEEGTGNSSALRDRLASLEAEVERLRTDLEKAEAMIDQIIEFPDDEWIADQLRCLGEIILANEQRAAILLRALLGKVRVYRVNPPGKKRGYHQLRFHINAWEMIRGVISDRMPDETVAMLTEKSGPGSPEFCLNVGGPTRMDELGPVIAKLREEGVKWKDICEETGLGLGPAYQCWKRFVDNQADNDGLPPDEDEKDVPES